jgi:hypothetical protein
MIESLSGAEVLGVLTTSLNTYNEGSYQVKLNVACHTSYEPDRPFASPE